MFRTALAAVLLIVFLPAMVVANTSTWALRTVLDPDTFATTAERALEAPSLEALVATSAADGVVAALGKRSPADLQSLTTDVLGLDAAATRAQISAALAERIQRVFEDSTARRVRKDVIASVHGYLLGTVEGTPGMVTVRGKDVVLDPSRVVDRIVAVADPRIGATVASSGLAEMDPVVVAQVSELQPIRRTIDVMQTLEVIVPLVAIAVALLIVVIAHRRERALGIVGAAVALAGLVSLAVIWLAGAYVTRIPDAKAAQTITSEVYDAFLTTLREQAMVLVVAGGVIVVVAWFLGRRARRRAVARMLGPRDAGPSETGTGRAA